MIKNYKDLFLKRKVGYLILLLIFSSIEAHGQKVSNKGVKTRICINALSGMQYDVVRFKVKPKSRIKIILTNKSEEDHNLVITLPKERLKVVNRALRLGAKGESMDYIPESKNVLYSIPIVSSGKRDSVMFITPEKEGIYPYVCTYPGHGRVMYGAMYVTTEEPLPDLNNDKHVPKTIRENKVK